MPLYPLTPLAYLTITGFALVYVASTRPAEVFWALALLIAGFCFYLLTPKAAASGD